MNRLSDLLRLAKLQGEEKTGMTEQERKQKVAERKAVLLQEMVARQLTNCQN